MERTDSNPQTQLKCSRPAILTWQQLKSCLQKLYVFNGGIVYLTFKDRAVAQLKGSGLGGVQA